ncbi:MAG: SDR family NAD(P)-dependent oxidoreductase [Rhodospirillum sp.]|nr:SDR family NAD(P)-dependent oxidoreductase [Rhodospirillum sp.]MCF8489775.1 SDR family NAD(P)-dependent oxidoreductase [Rhodospirillum sp.]MCF8502946.1 SDR family NAD(P)-dependent oxidoreductase [Rhodospirillum sp.]
MQIEGQAAIVTGGASGLGAATARMLAEAGAKVTILDRAGEEAAKVAATIGGLGLGCDVTDGEGVALALEQARSAHGVERILIQCAGIGTAKRIVGKQGPMDLADFEKVIKVNLIGSFNVLRLSAAAMTATDPLETGERGVVERGVIIMTASVAAYDGQLGQAAYAASKGGIVSLTLPAAREFAPRGVRVATIAPGLFATPLLEELPDEVRAQIIKDIPLGRLGRPEEFAELVRACVINSYLSGEVIRLDGVLRLPPR